MSKKKRTLKTEITRVEGIFTQNILDLSRRIDRVEREAQDADADRDNLRTKLAMDHQAVVNLVEQVKELQKARGYGTTMEEMVNKISAENPSIEAQATIKRQAAEIEQLRAGWNNEVSVLRKQADLLRADAQRFKEMEATWKRVAEERLREIEQLRADDTDLREDLELHRNKIAELQKITPPKTDSMWKRKAEDWKALAEQRHGEITMLKARLEEAVADARDAKSRAVPYNPFRPGCE